MFKPTQPSKSNLWSPLTVHREHWERKNCAFVYEYDPADDGPEVAIIKLVNSAIQSESV